MESATQQEISVILNKHRYLNSYWTPTYINGKYVFVPNGEFLTEGIGWEEAFRVAQNLEATGEPMKLDKDMIVFSCPLCGVDNEIKQMTEYIQCFSCGVTSTFKEYAKNVHRIVERIKEGEPVTVTEMAEDLKDFRYGFTDGNVTVIPCKESVDHPAHYNQHPSGIEAIQICEHMGFNIGNAIKYLWRADHKNGLEDLKKAEWYVKREIERLSKKDKKDKKDA